MNPSFPRWRRVLLTVLLAAVLAVIFAAYLQPAFIVDIAQRIALCF